MEKQQVRGSGITPFSRLATVAMMFLMCEPAASAHQYKILVDLNQIHRHELSDAWKLKCDGVWATLHNSDGVALTEWQMAFDLMGPGEVYTEDDYFSPFSYNLAVAIVGIENVVMGGGYVEPTLTPEYLSEILPDDKIDERYANQQNKPVVVLTRAYDPWRFADVQRALSNPKVGGVVWELDTTNVVPQGYYRNSALRIDAGIRATLASGKKCFLLISRTTSTAAEGLHDWLTVVVPDVLDDPNLYFIPAAYEREIRVPIL